MVNNNIDKENNKSKDTDFDDLEEYIGSPSLETHNVATDEYVEILQDFFETVYKKEIDFLATNYPTYKSLEIDYKKLEEFDINVAERLIESPQLILDAANKAITKIDIGVLDTEIIGEFSPYIRFYNLPDDYIYPIKDIGSEHLSKFISCDGVIRQMTQRLEKMISGHFVCKKCGASYDIPQHSQILVKPNMCECKHRDFELNLEQSKFIDYQKIQIQEPLENLKGSEQASNIDIYLSDDLVNKCVAGDRLIVTGTVRLRPPKGDSNLYTKYIIANHIEKTEQEFDELKISPDEEKEIKMLSKKDDVYNLLSESIAPNIYGHEVVKQAITLQMFNGVKKNIGKQELRGNIHILLVGDPSTGKSQLLRYADSLAPKSIYVAGKTTTGAGLTVSAVKDDFGEGGWTLKAGAVILANGGIAMIDEFDKMSTDDRSSLHEAMAQGTVSVSKAGLYSKFKSNTSILAAANPKFNRFDKYKNPIEQIDLPFSLISRFDLYFIIRDTLNKELDKDMGAHIIQTHKTAEKISQAVHNEISKEELETLEQKILPKINAELFKKYVAYARQNCKPILTDEASDLILNYYIKLRDIGRASDSFSATPRQLEGLIRLSEASAKIKLKKNIEKEDAERAILIFKTSLEQTAMDLETGKIDIDILSSGQSSSERNQLKKVLNIIRDLSITDAVSINDLVEFCDKEGMPKDKLNEYILKLKKMSEIYEPRHGYFKATDK